MPDPLDPTWFEAHRLDPSAWPEETLVGIDEALAAVESAVRGLDDRPAGHAPRSHLLLYGPSGIGKTSSVVTTARNHTEVPFYAADPGELDAAVVRAIVRELPARHPRAVLAIAEADWAINRDDLRHSDATRALRSAFISAIDALRSAPGILLAVTTTRTPSELDPALVRPGRFGTLVRFPAPDQAARRELLRRFLAAHAASEGIDLERAAALTRGWTPADLRATVERAAAAAAADGRGVSEAYLRAALQPEPGSREPALADHELLRLARHEAGHVAVALACLADAPSRLRVVRVGAAGCHTEIAEPAFPVASELAARLAVAYGGQAAEQALSGEASTACTDDVHEVASLLGARLEAGLEPLVPALPPSALEGLASPALIALWSRALVNRADEAQGLAERVVDAEVAAVERLADALLAAGGELAGEELREALRNSGIQGVGAYAEVAA